MALCKFEIYDPGGKAPECAWHRCFFRIKYFGLSALSVHPDLRHRVVHPVLLRDALSGQAICMVLYHSKYTFLKFKRFQPFKIRSIRLSSSFWSLVKLARPARFSKVSMANSPLSIRLAQRSCLGIFPSSEMCCKSLSLK